MKRIIDGVTYNTETSTLVAERTVTDEGSGTVTEVRLYQNRAGVYFEVETVTTTYRDRNEEVQERVSYNWADVGDAQKARDWCEKYELTIVGEINDLPPEAEPGEKLATLYIRLPPSLKFSIEDRAKRQGVSANVFALRCLEGCVAPAIHGKASDVPGPHAPALSGELSFDYSSYNGRYAIGEEHLRFDTLWSKAGSDCIYILNDPPSISGVAIAVGAKSISDVKDASVYDFTSRTRTPRKGEIVILKNVRGYFAAIEILGVKDNTRMGADKDELHLRYVINPDGSGAFNGEG